MTWKTVNILALALSGFLTAPSFAREQQTSAKPNATVIASKSTPELKATVGSYADVAAALAEDKLDAAQTAAIEVANRVKAALPNAKDAAAQEGLKAIQVRAENLRSAENLETARKEFQTLSEHVISLIRGNDDLKGHYHVFKCPMVEGFNMWIQAGESTKNPYYGKQMQTCGLKAKTI